MNVVARPAMVAFWTRYPQAETPLEAWYATVTKATYKEPAEIKTAFGTSVDFVGDNRVIFDIGGNKFRLIVHVSYVFKAFQIKFIGTHKEYDKIDPLTVSL
jgi:mRNA interferase HigB